MRIVSWNGLFSMCSYVFIVFVLSSEGRSYLFPATHKKEKLFWTSFSVVKFVKTIRSFYSFKNDPNLKRQFFVMFSLQIIFILWKLACYVTTFSQLCNCTPWFFSTPADRRRPRRLRWYEPQQRLTVYSDLQAGRGSEEVLLSVRAGAVHHAGRVSCSSLRLRNDLDLGIPHLGMRTKPPSSNQEGLHPGAICSKYPKEGVD